jgi:RNA polymerase sigma factor (sigma-70 family)
MVSFSAADGPDDAKTTGPGVAIPLALRSNRSVEASRMTPSPGAPGDEALLARYVRTHDRGALEELVARRWPETYRLALRLLSDPAAAEDAAQDAFVALVRAAGSFEPGRAFGPWFRTLVMNSVRKSARTRGRRRRHEEGFAATRPVSVTSNEGERRLFGAEADEHLRRLPLDLRSPLVLHYYEGCTQEEVAAVLGCPRTTVTTRIRRGLEQLRGSLLGAGCAVSSLELETWCMGARARASDLVASKPPTVAALEAGAKRSPLGGLGLGRGVPLLAVVALAIALGARPGPPEPVGLGPEAAAVGSTLPGEQRDAATPTSERGAAPAEVTSAAGAPTVAGAAPRATSASDHGPPPRPTLAPGRGAIVGLVLGPDGPVRSARLRAMVIAVAGGRTTAGQAELETDARGWFVLADVPPGRFGIELGHRAQRCHRVIPVEPGEVAEGLFHLEAGVMLVGRVTVAEDRPALGALVTLSRDGAEVCPGVRVDREGRYRFEGLVPGTYVVSAEPPQGLVGTQTELVADVAQEYTVPDLALGRGATVTGRTVQRGSSTPVGGVEVELRAGSELLGRAVSDSDGRFRIGGVPAGSVRAQVASAEQGAPGGARAVTVDVAMFGEVPVGDLEVDASKGRVTGRALLAGGPSLPGAAVELASARASYEARSDEHGRFEFGEVLDGSYELTARQGALVSQAPILVEVRDGSPVDADVVLGQSGSIVGAIAAAPGGSTLFVSAEPLDRALRWRAPTVAPAGRDGRFRLEGLAPGRYRVSVPGAESEVVHVVAGGEQLVSFTLALGTGRVRVKVSAQDPGRAAPQGTFMALALPGRFQLGSTEPPLCMAPGASGEATLDDLRAGTISVMVVVVGSPSQMMLYRDDVLVTEGATSEVELAWPDPARAGRIVGRVQGGAGARATGVTAIGDGVLVGAELRADGTFVLEGVPAGTYRLVSTSDGEAPRLEGAVSVTVEPGRTTESIVVSQAPASADTPPGAR